MGRLLSVERSLCLLAVLTVGDGGKGGDVIIEADPAVMNLWGFKKKQLYKGDNGGAGAAQKKHGRNGDPLILKVPEGTIVYEKNEDGLDELLGDLEKEGDQVVVAQGGRGRLGECPFCFIH